MGAKLLAALCAVALGGSLAACGGSDDDNKPSSTAAAQAKALTKIKVGLLPTTANAPIFMGIQRGFFKQEGLDAQPEVLGSGAVIFPSLMSGSLQFSFTGASSVIMARAKGLPVKIVADAGTSQLAPLMVRKDSAVKSFADLKGKTIGVTSLGNVSEFSTVSALEQAGVKKKDVKLLEVPFADAQTALERKTVEAVWSSPPFSTRMLKTGKFRSIGTTISGDHVGFGNSVFASTDKYLGGNAKTAAAFARAVDKSTQYATEHPEELLKTISSFMKIEPGLLAAEDVAEEVGELKVDRLDKVQQFLVANGYMKEPVPTADYVWKEAGA